MNLQIAKDLAQSAQDRGWRLLIVGGFVRDMVLGVKSKDVDCEVYGVSSVEELIAWLSDFGDVNAVGASFGVLKLNVGGIDLDVSLPRRENKEGVGHKGFIVEPDPTMTPKQAAARRDFTFNAMAYDPLTKEVLDFFGGKMDLEYRNLRHTSDAFAEDPLRVLRGMQFAGRFTLTPTCETVDLCQGLRSEYQALAVERVWGEWEKWAERSVWPSSGLEFLDDCLWLRLYSELYDLVECEQDSAHHPEGDAWNHSLYTVDAMAKICERENITGQNKAVLIFSALLHDVGKPLVTEFNAEKKRITAYGHDKAGGPLAASFLKSIGAPQSIIERVVPLVENHMRHVNFHTGGKPCARHARRLARDLYPATVQQWAYVVEADNSGRPPLAGGLPAAAAELLRIAGEVAVKDAKPKSPLKGRHLIEMGMTPGPHFGDILRKADEAFIEGEFATVEEGKEWVKCSE